MTGEGEDEAEGRLGSAGLDAGDVGVHHLDLAGELGLAEAALFAGAGDVGAELFGRLHPAEAIYGDIPIRHVGNEIVADWLAGGGRAGSVQGLCSMFNDAASVKAGRLIDRNPFQKLGISRGKGRRDQQPPTEQQVWEMIAHARKLACPSFAAWLQVAAFTGLRPGELDAVHWERIDFDRHRIVVAEQFSAATRAFDTPKNHLRRNAPLTAHARDALLGLAREGEFCFVSLRGEHWTPSSRAYHWKAVRAAAEWEGSLYLATHHFAGWYMVNELEMSSEDVAIALGHQDGGNLVRRLCGHRDKGRALDPDRRRIRHTRREPSQASGIINANADTGELVLHLSIFDYV